MANSFILGLALGAGIAAVASLGIFSWIIIRNLRPLGWALLLAGFAFLLTHL